MFGKYMKTAISLTIIVYPLPVIIFYLLTGDFLEACAYALTAAAFVIAWICAMLCVYDFFRKWRQKK